MNQLEGKHKKQTLLDVCCVGLETGQSLGMREQSAETIKEREAKECARRAWRRDTIEHKFE